MVYYGSYMLRLAVQAASLSSCTAYASQQQPLRGSGKGNGPLDENFGRLVNETLERWKCPGLSIGVVDSNYTWTAGYGIATFPSTPVEASTLFMVGSTTKAFTAAAMSLMVDDNDLYPDIQWDTPISNIIKDDFVLEDEYYTTHITIEDSLSHRSGMPRHDMSYGGHYDGHHVTPKDMVRSLRHLPLTAEIRTKWQYCNLMYVVASYVIETMTGSWLGDVIRTRILEPLGMKSTYFSADIARKSSHHLAQGYYYKNGSYHEAPDMDLHQVTGAGFIISNVLDYTKWIRALIDQDPPISKAGHKAIRTPRMLQTEIEDESPWTGPSAYSLGWSNSVYQGYEVYEHSGGMEAFGALVIIVPELGYGLVAFGNIAVGSNVAEEALLWHLLDERLGIQEEQRFDWNKKNQRSADEAKHFYENAKSILFPNVPSPPLPPSLPLNKYIGTYWHPAYRNMTITLPSPSDCSRLHIDRTDVTWKMSMDLEHVSSEHFIAWTDSLTAPEGPFKTATAVEFRVGVDGTVTEFGARLEERMGDEKIWFKRI